MERDGTERQGRASPKVFRGSRPGDEAPSLSSNIVTSTTVIGVFWLQLIIPSGTNGGDGNQQLVLWGVLHGGRGGNWHGCIAKTKHMAGSLVWSGLYGFWTFLIFFFFVSSFLDCIMFPVPSSSFKREGGMGGDTTHVRKRFLLVTWVVNLYMSLFARARSPASSSHGSLVSFFI